MKFSIIIVTYNSGKRLLNTINSILCQTYDNYEVIIKDGGSVDDSLSSLPTDKRIKFYTGKDNGIYDAMNIAGQYVTGDYVIYMNTGDYFYENTTLIKVNEFINSSNQSIDITYGNLFIRSRNGFVKYPDSLSNYQLLTRNLCHQTMFFKSDIVKQYLYDYKHYHEAADFEFYIRCVKEYNKRIVYIPEVIASYEGLGASENIEARKRILATKSKVLKKYTNNFEFFKYQIVRFITFKSLKEYVSCFGFFSVAYELLAKRLIKKSI